MSKQMQYSSGFSQLTLLQEDEVDTQEFVEETRQLFNHQGSDTELLELVIAAADIINSLCDEPKEHGVHSDVA